MEAWRRFCAGSAPAEVIPLRAEPLPPRLRRFPRKRASPKRSGDGCRSPVAEGGSARRGSSRLRNLPGSGVVFVTRCGKLSPNFSSGISGARGRCRSRHPSRLPSDSHGYHGTAMEVSGTPAGAIRAGVLSPPISIRFPSARDDELLDQVRQRQTEADRDDKHQPERTGEEDQSDGPVHRECACYMSSLTPWR
jgi:hypothetical protein